MRAAIYCRFSSDLQDQSSLGDQERICRRYADQCGWSVTKVYSDAAISGTHENRPGYQELLRDARSDAFDVIVSEDLDRLNRKLEHTAGLFNILKFLGIELHTTSRGIVDDFQVGIGGLMSELYSKNLDDKGVPREAQIFAKG